MALTTTDANGWRWIRQADAANRALPLGPVADCRSLVQRVDPAGSGSTHDVTHHIGVNATYQSPIFLRAYFDPGTLPLTSYRYLGYVQTLAPKVLGVAVNPTAFGGPMARPTALFEDSCVDFMGPGDAAARRDTFGMPIPPVYPFNAMLTTARRTVTEFARTDAPLGFVMAPPGATDRPTGTDAANCASLVAQLNLSFLTPDALPTNMSCRAPAYGTLNPWTYPNRGCLRLAMEPLTFPMSASEFAQSTLIAHAVRLLQTCTAPQVTALDRTISQSDLRFARFLGPYALVNVATPENMDPVLCIWREKTGDTPRPMAVKVTLINYDAMDDAEEAATYAFLQRMAKLRRQSGITDAPPRVTAGKGRGAPMPFPMADGQIVTTITVTDTVYGIPLRPRRSTTNPYMQPISGISYDVEFAFDAFARKLVYRGITPPRIQSNLSAVEAAVSTYYTLLDAGGGRVDVSNFDLVGAPQGEYIPARPL
jgi:hypothetical protein